MDADGAARESPVEATTVLRRLFHGFRETRWRPAVLFALILVADNLPNAVDAAFSTGLRDALTGVVEASMIGGLAALPAIVAVVMAANRVSQPRLRALAIAAAIMAGSVLSSLLYSQLGDWWWGSDNQPDHDVTVSAWKLFAWRYSGWLGSVTTISVATALYLLVLREREAAAELHREELARIGLDRQMTEARLQVMQAQIEPHFLFNTLANVRRLHQIDPPLGRSMLRHLTAYLGAALPEMRAAQSTLWRELALTVAYLNVQKIRMGARLSFDVDVPAIVAAANFPPMMLLTLVENAIKHGVGPLPDGGAIRIAAREADGVLSLEVADTGCGIAEGSGPGIGLANLRSRLSTLFGAHGQVALEPNLPQGCLATITLPFERSPSGKDAA